MATAMRVPTIFTAVDRFSNVVQGMHRNTQTFSAGLNRMDRRMSNSFGRLSQFMIAGGVGGLLYKAGDDIVEYEKAIASLGAVTGTKVGSMTKDIQSLGKETGHSVIEITKGFEQVGSKMSEYLSNPTALRAISKQGILMAEASRMSVDDSVDNLTSLLNQFGKGYQSAEMFVNKLSSGEDIGASTIPETIDILRQFAASARMAGAGVTESIAMVQAVTKTLGKQGVGRNFRNIMVDLNTGKGMDKNKLKALSMVGININKMIDPATTFVDKMKELTKLSGNKQAMGMFFKKTGFEAGATFLREFATFEKYLDFIEKNNTATQKAAKNNNTFAYSLARLKDRFTNFVVADQNANSAMNVTRDVIIWMTNNMGFLINLIGSVVVAFMAWKAIVGIVTVVSGVMTAFNAIMSVHRFVVMWASMTNMTYASSLVAVAGAAWLTYWPILLIIAAIGALVYAFWDSSRSLDQMVGDQISSITKGTDVVDGQINKQIAALQRGDKAWINSTNVQAREIQKQKQAASIGNYPDSIQKRSETMLNTFKTAQSKMDAARKQNALLPKNQQLSEQALNYQVRTGFYDQKKGSNNKSENLAGQNMMTLQQALKASGGTLNINLNDPNGVVKDYDDTKTKGVKVQLGSTIGQRGNQNGY